jgi:hypothetical protein
MKLYSVCPSYEENIYVVCLQGFVRFTLFLFSTSFPIFYLSHFPFVTCYVLLLHKINFTFSSPSSCLIFGKLSHSSSSFISNILQCPSFWATALCYSDLQSYDRILFCQSISQRRKSSLDYLSFNIHFAGSPTVLVVFKVNRNTSVPAQELRLGPFPST